MIAQSWTRSRGIGEYLKKRALRIGPGFVAVLLFGVVVAGPLGCANLTRYVHDPQTLRYLRPLALQGVEITLPGVFPNNPWPEIMNGSLWTIPYEVKCYLLLAAAGLIGWLRRPRLVLGFFLSALMIYNLRDGLPFLPHPALLMSLSDPERLLKVAAVPMFVAAWRLGRIKQWAGAAFLVALGLYHWAPSFHYLPYVAPLANLSRSTTHNSDWAFWPRLATYFLAGMTFFVWRDCVPLSRRLVCAALLILVISCRLPSTAALMVTLPICGSYVLLYAAYSRTLNVYGFARRGDLSYGLYLYGMPVQQILLQHLGKQTNTFVLTLVAGPVACVLAALSWKFVERPFLKMKQGPEGEEKRNRLAEAARLTHGKAHGQSDPWAFSCLTSFVSSKVRRNPGAGTARPGSPGSWRRASCRAGWHRRCGSRCGSADRRRPGRRDSGSRRRRRL